MNTSFAKPDALSKEIDLVLDFYLGVLKLQDYCRKQNRLNEVSRCEEIISHLVSLLNKLTSANKKVKPNRFKSARVINKIISQLAFFDPDSQSEAYILISNNLDKYNYQ